MLVLTLGDPLSITQSCLMRLLPLWAECPGQTVVLVGSLIQWMLQAQARAWPLPRWTTIQGWQEIGGPGLYFFSIDQGERPVPAPELLELERGQLAIRALETLRNLVKGDEGLAVLTAPIDKKVCSLAGFKFPGQTEFFMDLWAEDGIMILAGPRLRVALASNHLALEAVPAAIHKELILRKVRLLQRSLQEIFHIQEPHIAVAALNPHAGDRGLFGEQEQTILEPAVQALRAEGVRVTGPLPADTVFFRAYEGAYDAVLAMYHDQGLAPLKTVHFYDAVNITGGLSALRLSPDHGPASELFSGDTGREDSFRNALQLAHLYLKGKQHA